LSTWSLPDLLLRLPSLLGSYLLAETLLCKTSTVNLNLELLSHNVMGDIFKDWCTPQHDDESLTNPAAAWKVPPFTSSAFSARFSPAFLVSF
jgi:hypothetical protein